MQSYRHGAQAIRHFATQRAHLASLSIFLISLPRSLISFSTYFSIAWPSSLHQVQQAMVSLLTSFSTVVSISLYWQHEHVIRVILITEEDVLYLTLLSKSLCNDTYVLHGRTGKICASLVRVSFLDFIYLDRFISHFITLCGVLLLSLFFCCHPSLRMVVRTKTVFFRKRCLLTSIEQQNTRCVSTQKKSISGSWSSTRHSSVGKIVPIVCSLLLIINYY